MAKRIAGRNGRMYVELGTGAATPVMFMESWTLNRNTARFDVTAQGDTGMVYTSGLPDAQGDYSGFLDVDAPQFYAAASDGVARKMYLYPDTTDATKYWYGTALFDFSTTSPVSGPAAVSGTWAAATDLVAVGWS
jgi:hypothetical protein